jgi:integrase
VAKRYSRRARGEGAIIETADGRLRGKLVIPYPDGRQVTRWVSGRSRAEVSRKLEAAKDDVKAGLLATASTADYLAGWSAAVAPSVRPSTSREYARHVRQYWTPAIGDVPLSALTAAHVERVMAAMTARGLSPRTVRYARTTLRRALGDAIRDGLLVRNAAALSRPPRQERPELRPLTRTEARTLLEATAEDRFGPLYALLVGTGLRIGEAVALSWTDVDDHELTVRRSVHRAEGKGYIFGEPKTRQSRRTVTLPAIARRALETQRTRQDAARAALRPGEWQDTRGLIFTDPIGRPLSPLLVSADFREAADRLGLPVRLHDLRHTFATLALTAGVPLKTVSSALGHSSIAITADVYAHVTPELRDEAAAALDRAFGGES